MATAILVPGKEKRVYSGHPWIFRSDIEKVKGEFTPGDVVTVQAKNGRFLAKAIYNPASQIALRILSHKDVEIDAEFIKAKVKRAIDYRRTFADLHSCRLIFAESDGLPAVIADSFGDVISLQCLALGMEQFKDAICDALEEELHPRGIYERGDVPVRELEGLPLVCQTLRGEVPDRVLLIENGVKFHVDVKNGQKTGFFLDQKYNRAAVARLAKGHTVLDCFTHTGSFALNAALGGARHVTAVDISADAIEMAKRNAERNGLTDRMDFIATDVFDLLPSLAEKKHDYDFVILDPPAFTKNRKTVKDAIRGYKEINYRAMKLLPRGGFLATCSCSHFMEPDAFVDMLQSAARDAGVQLKLIEARRQSPDHPVVLGIGETDYLKFYLFQVI